MEMGMHASAALSYIIAFPAQNLVVQSCVYLHILCRRNIVYVVHRGCAIPALKGRAEGPTYQKWQPYRLMSSAQAVKLVDSPYSTQDVCIGMRKRRGIAQPTAWCSFEVFRRFVFAEKYSNKPRRHLRLLRQTEGSLTAALPCKRYAGSRQQQLLALWPQP